jgi:hypothetical protein
MSFWDLSDGDQVSTEKEYEAPSGGGNLILPDGSSVMASIDECKWQSFQGGEEHISARWNILAPEEYQGRKIFQKMYPEGDTARNTDPAKAKKKGDTAKRMLAAIDANCGGGLMKLQRKPSDEDFAMHLTNKPMVIRLGLWDLDGKQGNWVQAVSPASKPVSVDASKVTKAAPKAVDRVANGTSRYDDSEIPF